jgi:AraC-like DNA-binding protein
VAEAIELVVTELSDSRETADVPKRLRDSGVVELAVREQRAAVRVDAVRLPDEQLAWRAGYDSKATMRAQFATRLKTSPRAYRRTFRATETQSTKSSDGSIATLP